jgi:hypothetical protein
MVGGHEIGGRERQMTYPQYGYPGTQSVPMRNGLGTASLVLGIVAIALGWIPFIGLFGFICGVVGIALGIAGIIRASKGFASNRAMAIVGTVLSSVAVIISLLVWLALASAISTTARPFGAMPAAASPQVAVQDSGAQQTRFEAGQTADIDGLVITAGRLQRSGSALGSLVCSNVQYENRSGKTRSYSSLSDWKLQNPNGVVVTPTLLGETLGSGELVPGGHVTGKTCFEDPRLAGEYVIINDELFSFSNDRVEWRTTL